MIRADTLEKALQKLLRISTPSINDVIDRNGRI